MCIPDHFMNPTAPEPSFEAPEDPWGYSRIGVDPAQGPDRTVVTRFTPEQLERIARNTAHGVVETTPTEDEPSAEPWRVNDRALFMEQFADKVAHIDAMAEQSLWGVRCSEAGTEVNLECTGFKGVLDLGVADTETDPTGRDPHTPGAKLDAGKNRMALVLRGFARALALVGEVGTYGAGKYTPNGWKEVPDGEERYLDAAFRHLFEDALDPLDSDTNLHHLAQAVWNLLAVLEFRLGSEPQ